MITNAVISTKNGSADEEDSNEFVEQESDDEEKESEGGIEISDTKGITTNPTPKFVGNKRKNMEKRLSANQRDQMYLDMAKDEEKLKL